MDSAARRGTNAYKLYAASEKLYHYLDGRTLEEINSNVVMGLVHDLNEAYVDFRYYSEEIPLDPTEGT